MRILSESQKIAARDAARRYRAKQRGESVQFIPSKRTANAASFTTAQMTKHGLCESPEYSVWKDMKRRCRFVELDGERLTISDWARRRGVSRFLIRDRLDAGLSPRAAILGVGNA